MSMYNNPNAFWDLSLPPTSLPALGDEDFLTLLQKQFGVTPETTLTTKFPDSTQEAIVNPQDLTRSYSNGAGNSPSSGDDSSPSPPSNNDGSTSRRQSGVYGTAKSGSANDDDAVLKRKASEEDLDEEPNPKNQHTANAAKKTSPARRKSSSGGAPTKDESRLLKRKEQNRAAQRAFRERKEKHVKDLEDQVAALEEKNTSTQQENSNLKEIINRLQNENIALRQSAFTFSVPKGQPQTNPSASPQSSTSSPSMNVVPSSTTSTTASSHDSPQSLFANDTSPQQHFMDPNSFTFFNPAAISMLEQEQRQEQTATTDAMSLDFGFGPVLTSTTPYTTIAANPMFMSFREPSPYQSQQSTSQSNPSAQMNNTGNANNNANNSSSSFSFGGADAINPSMLDFGSSSQGGLNFASWPDSTMQDLTSFEELFSSEHAYRHSGGALDYGPVRSPPPSTSSMSPVNHVQNGTSSQSMEGQHNEKECPKTKADMEMFLARDPGSAFAPSPSPISNSASASTSSPATSTSTPAPMSIESAKDFTTECFKQSGRMLPKTEKSDKNVEVMHAWKSITSNPAFSNIDMNDLCLEFAEKARCDGTKVVLEPSGIRSIIEKVVKSVETKSG